MRPGTGGGAGEALRGGTGGAAVLPIPNPDTLTPAWLNLLTAPWFSIPWLGFAGGVWTLSWYVGGGAGELRSGREFCLGGSRGGNLGFCDGAVGRAGVGLGGKAASGVSCPRRLAGGLGRFAVDKPVVSTRYGPGGGLCSSSSSACAAAICLCCESWTCCCVKGAPRLASAGVSAVDDPFP